MTKKGILKPERFIDKGDYLECEVCHYRIYKTKPEPKKEYAWAVIYDNNICCSDDGSLLIFRIKKETQEHYTPFESKVERVEIIRKIK